MKRTTLKNLPEGEKMPYDFWNYLVNPITGYYVEPKENFKNENKRSQIKYHTTTQKIG